MHVCVTVKNKAMSLKKSKEFYMEGFGLRKGKGHVVIIISKKFLTLTVTCH